MIPLLELSKTSRARKLIFGLQANIDKANWYGVDMLKEVRIFKLWFYNSNSICIHSIFESRIKICPLFSLSEDTVMHTIINTLMLFLFALLCEHRMF